MPFKTDRLRVLAGSIEAAAGIAETLDATDAVNPAFAVTYADNTAYNVRENHEGGKLQGRRGALIGQIGFDIEARGLAATGAVPDWADRFLPACGYVKSTATFTRTREVANQKTVTLESFIDGQYRRIYGAAGNVQLIYNAGRRSFFRFLFTGIVDPVDEASNLDPTLITVQPILGAATFTYNSVTMKAPTATLDFGCTVAPIESVGASGYERFCISDYNPTLTVEPYAEAQSVVDFDADWTNNAERALSLVLGSSATNIITIAATKCSQNAPPGFGERSRLATRIVSLDINDDAAPTIVFS